MTGAGREATAKVELTAAGRKAAGIATGDDTGERSLSLVGEATVRAVQEFLPPAMPSRWNRSSSSRPGWKRPSEPGCGSSPRKSGR